jgi:hypothetical protein
LHPLVWKELSLFTNKLDPKKTPEPIGGPFSLIYSIFSKEEQAKRRLKELEKMETIRRKIRSKYNSRIVSEILGIKGKELDKFLEFCNFTDEYLLKTKKIDILQKVKKKYQEFLKQDSLKIKQNDTIHSHIRRGKSCPQKNCRPDT